MAMTQPAAAVAYEADKHPRDERGRFAMGADRGTAPSMRTATVIQMPTRSLTRGESWQRTGAKLADLPISYTGSTSKEAPVGGFSHIKLTPQRPDSISPEDHAALIRRLVGIIKEHRHPAIAKATERGLIPEGSDRHTVNRAYNHASLLAMHDFGTADYEFKMDDHLKGEMKPLEGFIRYARRRVKDHMLATQKGQWRPYRKAFGKPLPTPKTDPRTGEERLRMRPNQELIKRRPLAKLTPQTNFWGFRVKGRPPPQNAAQQPTIPQPTTAVPTGGGGGGFGYAPAARAPGSAGLSALGRMRSQAAGLRYYGEQRWKPNRAPAPSIRGPRLRGGASPGSAPPAASTNTSTSVGMVKLALEERYPLAKAAHSAVAPGVHMLLPGAFGPPPKHQRGNRNMPPEVAAAMPHVAAAAAYHHARMKARNAAVAQRTAMVADPSVPLHRAVHGRRR